MDEFNFVNTFVTFVCVVCVTKNYENSLNYCTGICFLSSEIFAVNDALLSIYPSTELKAC